MTPRWHRLFAAFLALGVAANLPGFAHAQAPLNLRESFTPGYQYHVSTRVEISGTLTPPPRPGAPAAGATPRPVTVTGQSVMEYDERFLGADAQTAKAIRIYRTIDLHRRIGDQPQESTLRPAVRRLVVLRNRSAKVPFSPDGPLTWGEIDLIRTELFTPSLVGLLPDKPVKPGDRWQPSPAAVSELTDLEKVEEGSLECRLDEIASLAGRRHARVSISGSVRGVNEDGPTRQQIDGYFYFDLESNHLGYLSFKGVHLLLDGSGKESGRIEGRFTLTRQVQLPANQRPAELSDAALRGVALEPNADNTLLLYDNPELGVRLFYPRRWRIGAVQGRQVTLDEVNGNGMLITLDPLTRIPSGQQYLNESREYLEKQKAKVARVTPPRKLQAPPQELEHFSVDVEMSGQSATIMYYIARQANGGATMAARLLPRDLGETQREVERIARSVTITQPQR
jgi:hypothetical protein